MTALIIYLKSFFSPLIPLFSFGYVNDDFLNDSFTIKVNYKKINK
jgi:hypothetical protein